MCAQNSLSLISRDSRTPRNSGTNFKLEGENVTGYRYMIHLYCLAVQAGFYSDVVECWPVTQAARVRFPVGENVISIFSPVTFIIVSKHIHRKLRCTRVKL